MKLKKSEAAKMAQDNYLKTKENIRFGESEVCSSTKRYSGVGKGDANRVKNLKKYAENFDAINWKSKVPVTSRQAHKDYLVFKKNLIKKLKEDFAYDLSRHREELDNIIKNMDMDAPEKLKALFGLKNCTRDV